MVAVICNKETILDVIDNVKCVHKYNDSKTIKTYDDKTYLTERSVRVYSEQGIFTIT